MSDSVPHISVCVCTIRRPDRLRKLLLSLSELETDGAFDLSVVVVDNDRERSAQTVAEDLQERLKIPIVYVCEPDQNIARARNVAVNRAHGDLLALIDDDEFPPPQWLRNLLSTMKVFDAGCVMGPVLPVFEEPPPSWVLKGRFFERPAFKTGEILSWKDTRAGNVLFRRNLIVGQEECFDPRFEHGGEDQDFFRRLMDKGCEVYWCAEAPVFEGIRPTRWSLSFMMKRALMRGGVPLRHRGPHWGSILQSLAAIVIYTALMVPAGLVSRQLFIKVMLKNLHHVGRMLAFFRIDVIGGRYITD